MNKISLSLSLLIFLTQPIFSYAKNYEPIDSVTSNLQSVNEKSTIYANSLINQWNQKINKKFAVQLTDEQQAYVKKTLLEYYQNQNLKLNPIELITVANRNPKSGQHLSTWLFENNQFFYLGAAKISTGTIGRKGYFITPTGIFENRLEFGNYRAQGTPNEEGIRGLGIKNSRIFDLGWTPATPGWINNPAYQQPIRFQIHGTDPTYLEPKLGSTASKGCIRVDSTVNKFLDEFGFFDLHYRNKHWVVSQQPSFTQADGRYLIVLDY